jgi:hypothetical protein
VLHTADHEGIQSRSLLMAAERTKSGTQVQRARQVVRKCTSVIWKRHKQVEGSVTGSGKIVTLQDSRDWSFCIYPLPGD